MFEDDYGNEDSYDDYDNDNEDFDSVKMAETMDRDELVMFFVLRSLEHYAFKGHMKFLDRNFHLNYEEVATLHIAEKQGFVPTNDEIQEHIKAFLQQGQVVMVEKVSKPNNRWK